MFKLNNIINHYVVVVDESYSMYHRTEDVVKVVDNLTQHLAEKSKDLNQETRLSVYAFNSRGTERCLVWDIDVLRMPSIKGMYKPDGRTALIDCTLLAVDDLKTVPQKYGEHSFVLYVITDGQENDSRRRYELNPQFFNGLPDNWTLAVFVPSQSGKTEARGWGFPEDNISIWDTSTAKGIESVGATIRKTSTQLMENRTKGIRSSKSLFKLNVVTGADILNALKPLPLGTYKILSVPYDQRIDDFVRSSTGHFILGTGYYQLTKKETIQPHKNILISYGNKVYAGQARQLLGLPNEKVDVIPESYPNYTIFVQSTAPNRKLIGGTNMIVWG